MSENLSKNLILELSKKIGLNEVLTEILVKRGFCDEQKLVEFLEPKLSNLINPFELQGMQEAVDALNKHINGGKILVFGDYDCDGIGASALLYLALKEHGANVNVFIPTRVEDGYGLSESSLTRAIDNFNPTLILTVDCGIGSVDEVELAKANNVEIVVTDHHEPRDVLPNCTIVNPKIQEGAPELCGCGVAYMLVRALYGDKYAEQYLDVCAISTIADLVPLIGDNRIIASEGLKRLSNGSQRVGIKALLKVSAHKPFMPVTSSDIAFKLAPRLNASGRLSSAEKSLRLLTSNNYYECKTLAEELEAENKQRQELCASTIADARKQLLNYDLVKNRIIVLQNSEWEGGVIGIAAAKIAEEFHRPTILFANKDDILKGSCRSIAGINIHEVLTGAEESIIQFGGHQMAAGLSIKPENLEWFTSLCNQYIIDNYSDELFKQSYESDAVIPFANVNLQFVNQLKKLEPFGMGNNKPTFSAVVNGLPFERIKKLNHIKCKVSYNTEIVAFNELDNIETLRSNMSKTIFYNPDKETFMGKETVRCTFKNMVINEIIPNDTEILLTIAERYAVKADESVEKFPRTIPDNLFGRLIITWCKDTYMKLIEKYPTYVRALNTLSSSNPYNTILLAPKGIKNFSYYSEIILYDKAPHNYINALENAVSAKIVVKDNEFNLHIGNKLPTRDSLIKTYNYIRNAYNNKECEKLADMYLKCCEGGYPYDFIEFTLGYNILVELDIISIKDGIIEFSKDKKDLSKSEILKLSGGDVC